MYFLAHNRHEPDTVIDQWTVQLQQLLSATVVSGRDAFHEEAWDLGGFEAWIEDMLNRNWAGIVRPVHHGTRGPDGVYPIGYIVGKATGELIQGMLAAGISAQVWDVETLEFKQITHVADHGTKGADGKRSYVEWGRLIVA